MVLHGKQRCPGAALTARGVDGTLRGGPDMDQRTRRLCPMCGSARVGEPQTVNAYGAQTVTCQDCSWTMLPAATIVGSWAFGQITDHSAHAIKIARANGWAPENEPGDGTDHGEMVDHLVRAWLDGDASIVLTNGLGMDRAGMAASIATYAHMVRGAL